MNEQTLVAALRAQPYSPVSIFHEAATVIEKQRRRIRDLENNLWAASRQAHAQDEWEPEDG